MTDAISTPPDPSWDTFRRRSVWSAIVFSMFVGCIVLLGWFLDLPEVGRLLPGLATMKPNTAFTFVVAGLSLLASRSASQRNWVGILSALTVLGVGTATFVQFPLDLNFGIDQLLARDWDSTAVHPGRMSIYTSLFFILLGIELLLLHRRRSPLLLQNLAWFGLLISFLPLTGYLYGVQSLYGVLPFTSVALHTAITFIVLQIGVIAAAPVRGIVAILLSPRLEGTLTRRLLPAAIFLPLTLGWLRLQGELAGWYDTTFGLALFALANVFTFLGLILWAAIMLSRMAENLRASEERYRVAIESAEIGTWDVDLGTGEAFWPPSSFRISGYEPNPDGRVPYEMWHSRLHPDDLERIDAVVAKALEEHSLYTCEHRIRRADNGESVWLKAFGRFLYDHQGIATRSVGVFFNDTLYKQAEQDLLESRRQIRELLEGMPQLVWTCLPDGRCDYLSPQWVEYTGVPEAEQLGYGWAEAVHPDDRSPATEAWLRSVRTGKPLDVLFRIKNGQGDYRWFQTRATPFQSKNGEFVKWFGTNTDIDDQIRAEQALEENRLLLERRVEERTAELRREEERLKASLAEKEILLREIHHRVKNNLQIVSTLLQLQADHHRDAAFASLLQESQQRVRSMAMVHEQLYQSNNFAGIGFGEYLRELTSFLARSYNNSCVSIELQASTVDLPLDIAVPCGLLANELISNSLKHAFPGGRVGLVRVELSQVEEPTGKSVHLAIIDDGVGFASVPARPATESFGLRIVGALVGQLHGRITTTTVNGTRTCVTFPLA